MREIRLVWGGRDYVIPAARSFAAAERVEDVATIAEIGRWSVDPRFTKLARCYGELLRFAGARVTDEEIHAEVMAQVKAAEAVSAEGRELVAAAAMRALLEVLMDGFPEALAGKDDAAGKARPAS